MSSATFEDMQTFNDLFHEAKHRMRTTGDQFVVSVLETGGSTWHAYRYLPQTNSYQLFKVSNDRHLPLDVKHNAWQLAVELPTDDDLRAQMWFSVRNANGTIHYFNENKTPQLYNTQRSVHKITFTQASTEARVLHPPQQTAAKPANNHCWMLLGLLLLGFVILLLIL